MTEVNDLNNITYDFYQSIANRYNDPESISRMVDKYYCGVAIGHVDGGFKECIIDKDKAYVKYDYVYDRDKTKIVKYEVVIVISTKKNKVIDHYLKLTEDNYAHSFITKFF